MGNWRILFVGVALLSSCGRHHEPSREAPVSNDGPALSTAQKADALIGHLTRGEYAAAAAGFDKHLAKLVGPDGVRAGWQELVERFGNYQGHTAEESAEAGAIAVYRFAVQFEQGVAEAEIVFDGAAVGGIFFHGAPRSAYPVPDYVKRDSFDEKVVAVGSGDWTLPGRVTIPHGKGPFPAFVLVPGSGPQDEDMTVMANKPFRDIAWGLSSRGIVVLRYPKRMQVLGAKFADLYGGEYTAKEEAEDDALAALDAVRARPEVDPARVFLLGQSLGGALVPRIARRDAARARPASLAGLAILAGFARPLEDVVIDQVTYLDTLPAGEGGHPVDVDHYRALAARVKDPALSPDTPAKDLMLGLSARYWLDLRDYRPAAVATELGLPMLVLQGGRDYQVTRADYDIWEAALAGHPKQRTVWMPELNHLFEPGTEHPGPTEYAKPGFVDPAVIGMLADFAAPP